MGEADHGSPGQIRNGFATLLQAEPTLGNTIVVPNEKNAIDLLSIVDPLTQVVENSAGCPRVGFAGRAIKNDL